MLRQQRVEFIRASLFGRRDDLTIEAPRIDMRFERAPAWETVVAGNCELGLVQLGRWIARAQFVKLLLGGFLEPIDMRLGRKSFGHDKPSSSAPGVRGSQARKKGWMCSSVIEAG